MRELSAAGAENAGTQIIKPSPDMIHEDESRFRTATSPFDLKNGKDFTAIPLFATP
jgi:hypothetical protein